ncbi:hypothetical protein Q4F19_10440 [Sphingomonas sp. BIUV-7]|uniref:Fe-S oxidoreductase n=1 Tax=Sphingomonas natans TaxID=3063330 RepID=A0ABT8Y8Y5_9SPHN|nr:hypothetical protein [Sphingomonas sp. BIUV-7]MDO6414797.1 hypothetical protein [Sphingomonas sp. BIUV-7]
MKTSLIILAATLSFGSASAIAQTMPQDAATPPASSNMPTDATAPMAPAAPAAADPGMSAPASADSTMPPPAAAAPSAMPATTMPAPDAVSMPACSRTVTDKCVQKGGMTKKSKRK